jgi:thiamine biosynthesis lipoprotein
LLIHRQHIRIKNVLIISAAVCGLFLLQLSSFYSCAEKPSRMSKMYYDFFDTVSYIVGYETDEGKFEENCSFAADMLEEYHMLYDIYYEYADINNIKTINKNAGVAPVVVDEKIIDLIEYSIDMYYETDGLFNVALGAVLSIWHDYREAAADARENGVEPAVPTMEELHAASLHCNITDIVIDRENSTVYLKDPEMSLDVGSVAKGYATEMTARALAERGVVNYALNIGSNIRTIGTKEDGGAWAAGIQNPDENADKPYVVRVELDNMSLVTSGTYERYYMSNCVRYHHIINPNTLMPENDYLSVSILTADSTLGDVLSTAVFNMSYEEGSAFVEAYDGVEAFWIFSDGTTAQSSGFADYIIDSD